MINILRSSVLRLAEPLHKRLRNQKLDFLSQVIGPNLAGSLLDVGGGPGITGEFLRLYSSFASVTVLNLEPLEIDPPAKVSLDMVVADGCALPFAGGAFDWVFSNAVIEHVGPWKRQEQFAREIRRVAKKGYFVATPNRYFPLEPHSLLPFYQFLNPRLQRSLVRFSPGYLEHYEEIHLLSAREMRQLFPEARIKHIGLPLFPNNLVALYRKD